MLTELVEYNMFRLATDPAPSEPRVVLTEFSAEAAGYVLHPGGVRWVKGARRALSAGVI